MVTFLAERVFYGVSAALTDGAQALGETQHRDSEDGRETAGGEDGESEAGG